jgi:hypothetical protein
MAIPLHDDLDAVNLSKLINLPTPTSNGDAVPKSYVDGLFNDFIKYSKQIVFSFGDEEDTCVVTDTTFLYNASDILGVSFEPVETTATSLDDFKLNGVTFNLENFVANTSCDIRATAANGASGSYTINLRIGLLT